MACKIFITGTDTDVGKTFISALLCSKWKANYWKPIQTGLETDQGDTSTVLDLVGRDLNYSSPALQYQKPLSPWRACVLENKPIIDISKITIPDGLDKSTLIIEGAGGVFVPITDKLITTDLIRHFDIPVIVVAKSELGTLNHTLLTVEHLKNNNVKILGVILNGDINNDNAEALKKYGVNIIAQIPRATSIREVEHLIPDLQNTI